MEKRILTLDANIRKWNVVFFGMMYEEHNGIERYKDMKDIKDLQESLAKCNARHKNSNYFNKIELHSDFECMFPTITLYLSFVDSILQEWSLNVVDFSIAIPTEQVICLSSIEKLPNLKRFSFTQLDNCSNSEISMFLLKHADSLNDLELNGFIPEIPPNLKLTKFRSDRVDISTLAQVIRQSHAIIEELDIHQSDEVFNKANWIEDDLMQLNSLKCLKITYPQTEILISLLEMSKLSLEELELTGHIGLDDDRISELDNLKLSKLKSFTVINIAANMVEKILKASKNSLKNLDWNNEDMFYNESKLTLNLDSINLPLETLTATDVSGDNVAEIIKSSQGTLQKLNYDRYESTDIQHDNDNFFLENSVQLNLKILHTTSIKPHILLTLLSFSRETLQELSIQKSYWFHDDYDLEPLHMKQLKRLTVRNMSENIVSHLLETSCDTLQYFKLGPLYGEETFDCDSIQLQLTEFEAKDARLSNAMSVIKSSKDTLKSLHLDKLYDPDERMKTELEYLAKTKLNLEAIHISHNPAKLVALLISASANSLQKLKWENTAHSHESDIELNKDLSKLKEFIADDLSVNIAATVIKCSHASLEHLYLKRTLFNGESIKLIDVVLTANENHGGEEAFKKIDQVKVFAEEYQDTEAFKRLFDAIGDMLNCQKLTKRIVLQKE